MNSKTPQAKSSYLIDGDDNFIGLNSKDNATKLAKGFVSQSQNFRLDQGVATLRYGLKKMEVADISTNHLPIYASCEYIDQNGKQYIALVVANGLYLFCPDSGTTSSLITYPQPYGNGYGVNCTHIYQAGASDNHTSGYLYLCHGLNKFVFRYQSGQSSLQIPGVSTHTSFPNSDLGLYFNNRHIVKDNKNEFQVSAYLEDNKWSNLDVFTLDYGLGDEIIGIVPWQLNEFVVFMRNSIYYANAGVGGQIIQDLATNDDSYVKSLATDVGCIAKGSIVQAGGGILFLSDNGVLMVNPAGATTGKERTDGSFKAGNTPEGMRLVTLTEPLSMPIDDVIKKINYNYAYKAVGIYHQNRYYLAVPTESSHDNNVILVYNFLIKAWESVDTFPNGFDAQNLVRCKYGKTIRLFAVDSESGVLLLDELDYDEYGYNKGTPLINFTLGFEIGCTINPNVYAPNAIAGSLVTRGYTCDSPLQKRYSSLITDVTMDNENAILDIAIETRNPDSISDSTPFVLSTNENSMVRLPIKKHGYFARVRYNTTSYRPKIKSTKVKAILQGENIHIT
jgi:hypothetical protein